MREIKFRGKRTDNGEWVYGDYCFNPFLNRTEIISFDNERSYVYEVDPATVGQYTGLKDKNGVEIYEGDIVQFSIVYYYSPAGETIDGGKIGFIKFSEHETAIVIGDKDSDYFESDLVLLGDALRADDEMEVIGNIYDNPELLGVTE